MYSGSDSDSQKYSQLKHKSMAPKNNEQVDWAALAQQWIIMKESGPPPIPGEQSINLIEKINTEKAKTVSNNELLEASIDVENKKGEHLHTWNTPIDMPPPPGAEPWAWHNADQSWDWHNSWAGAGPTKEYCGPSYSKPALLPTPRNDTSPKSEGSKKECGSVSLEKDNPEYWTVGIHSKQIKPHNKRYSKVNVPIRALVTPPNAVPVSTNTQASCILETTKRKQLPAWIRDGLEKMEKEKLKQIEKVKEEQDREKYSEELKQSELEKIEILKSTMKEQEQKNVCSIPSKKQTKDSKLEIKTEVLNSVSAAEELVLRVRKTMTEILLCVTSRYIEQLCREEYQRYMKRIKDSVQVNSGTNISAKLGLGVYNDSDSSEEDCSDGLSDLESDNKLKDAIKNRTQSFIKIEHEIENKLAMAEQVKNISETKSVSPPQDESGIAIESKAQLQEEKNGYKSRRSYSSSSDSSNYLRNKSASSDSSESGSYSSERKSKYSSERSKKSPNSKFSQRNNTEVKKRLSRRSRSSSHSRRSRSSSSSYKETRGYFHHSTSQERDSSRYKRSSKRNRSRSSYTSHHHKPDSSKDCNKKKSRKY